MIKKRGVFFSTDAIIALSIIFLIILIAFPLLNQTQQLSNIHYDVLTTFSSLKVGDFQGVPSYLSIDPEKTIVEQIGEFYALGNFSAATELAETALQNLETNENIGIWYGNRLIASKNNTPIEQAKNIDTARQIVSGIRNESGATGFSARAFLLANNPIKYFYFGGYVGDGNITSIINYSGQIKSAEIELATEDQFDIYVNGVASLDNPYQGSSDEFTPVNYSLPITNFNPGENTIEFRGENLNIAGGFVKINYDPDDVVQTEKKYNFPGIEGLINLFDGFYVPSKIGSMDLHLHINSSVLDTILTIGNTTILNRTTNDEEIIQIDNATLSTLLDYDSLSGETIPLRLGLENVSFVTNQTLNEVDVVSITDLSGSMACTVPACSGSQFFCGICGGTWQGPINDAKTANADLTNLILNFSGNRVGAVGYEEGAKGSDFHELTTDNESLIDLYENEWDADGATCICCGILKGSACLSGDTNILKDNFNGQTTGVDPDGWVSGDTCGNVEITSTALEGDRSVLIHRNSGCQPFEQPSSFRNIQPEEEALSVEFMFQHSSGTNGRIDMQINGESPAGGSGIYTRILFYDGQIRTHTSTPISSYQIGQTYKIKIEKGSGADSQYDIYIDDSYVSTISAENTGFYLIDQVRFTGLGGNTNEFDFIFDNVTVELENQVCSTSGNQKQMIVMSDGQANRACNMDPVPDHDVDGDTTNDEEDHAIEAACRAKQIYNITTHAVGFGSSVDEQTLQAIASCGNGTYYFSDIGGLSELYTRIADDIIATTFTEQTIEVTGGDVYTRLYPDSYIEFDYEDTSSSAFGLIVTSQRKFSNDTSGNFSLPEDAKILETTVSSYSGPKWTENINANGNSAYELMKYGTDLLSIGDPYNINIPNSLISTNNIIDLTTTFLSGESSPGSESNKIIYTLARNITAFSPILGVAEGCIWDIQFEDNTRVNQRIPQGYLGTDQCTYDESSFVPAENDYGEIFNEQDSLQVAVRNLLRELDLDSNGKIDAIFSEGDLEIDLSEIEGIPYSWATEVQVRVWTP